MLSQQVSSGNSTVLWFKSQRLWLVRSGCTFLRQRHKGIIRGIHFLPIVAATHVWLLSSFLVLCAVFGVSTFLFVDKSHLIWGTSSARQLTCTLFLNRRPLASLGQNLLREQNSNGRASLRTTLYLISSQKTSNSTSLGLLFPIRWLSLSECASQPEELSEPYLGSFLGENGQFQARLRNTFRCMILGLLFLVIGTNFIVG